MAGGIGGKSQVIFFGSVAEVIENYAGLDTGDAVVGIDLEDVSHVLREIENDGYVAALPRQRCAPATAQERGTEFAADGDRGNGIIGIAWKNYSDGDLAIIGTVGGVKSAAAVVELDVATDVAAQGFVQPQRIGYG